MAMPRAPRVDVAVPSTVAAGVLVVVVVVAAVVVVSVDAVGVSVGSPGAVPSVGATGKATVGTVRLGNGFAALAGAGGAAMAVVAPKLSAASSITERPTCLPRRRTFDMTHMPSSFGGSLTAVIMGALALSLACVVEAVRRRKRVCFMLSPALGIPPSCCVR
jgi:hypothetical protein